MTLLDSGAAFELIWGLRQALHIHTRNRGRGEDPRYRKWRETLRHRTKPESGADIIFFIDKLRVY